MEEIKKQLAKDVDVDTLISVKSLYLEGRGRRLKYWLIGIISAGFIILFLPWTQNIRAKGSITTLRQEFRPQQLNSVIAGRIIKWYVKEGDYVKAGDTIVQLAEVKDSYLDPELVRRTNDQLRAKESGIEQYNNKVQAIASQIDAMQQSMDAKLRQLKLKVISDSMETIAATNDYKIAEAQLSRILIMRDSGLASTVQVEQRNQARQNALSKKISAENKYQNTKTEILQVRQDYNEKMYKARSEAASARSEIASGTAEVAKLANQLSNYAIRSQLYFLIAPQDGQIVRAVKSGLNEILKEGDPVVDIVPANQIFAVEIFVSPVDVPLLSIGQKVNFLFDGYPAIVFSGWPGASYGIFSGRVVVVENNVSENGKFRILVAEDSSIKPWPKTLKIGVGASAIALLKDVPVWYELWRDINGFPPDYYQANTATNDKKNKKDKK
jgi:multidrug resistance efflux pump